MCVSKRPISRHHRRGLVFVAVACAMTLASGCSLIRGTDWAMDEGYFVQVFVIDKAERPDDGRGALESQHADIVADIIQEECPTCRIERLLLTDGFGLRKALAAVAKRIEQDRSDYPAPVLINISLGRRGRDDIEELLVTRLTQAGALIVAAAGNEGTEEALYPAAYPGVVAVAGVEYGWSWRWPLLVPKKASYSNYGRHVQLAAKAGYAETRVRSVGGSPTYMQSLAEGSSFAAPRVVGLLGRLLTLDSSSTPADELYYVRETAKPLPDDPYFASGQLGAGVIDTDAAIGLWRAFIPNYRTCGTRRWERQVTTVFALIGVAAVVMVLALILAHGRNSRSGQSSTHPPVWYADALERLARIDVSLELNPDPEQVAAQIEAILCALEYHERDDETDVELDHLIGFLSHHNAGGRFDGLLARLRELERY